MLYCLSKTLSKTVLYGRMQNNPFTRIPALSKQPPFSILVPSNHPAFSTSAKPSLETTKAALVVTFFQKHGFSKSQINRMFKLRPELRKYNAEQVFSINFFLSKGFSMTDIVKMTTLFSTIFVRSLKEQIIPTFNFLSRLLESEEMTVKACLRLPPLITFDVKARIEPSIDILRDFGVPRSLIVEMFRIQPQILLMTPLKLKVVAETIREFGFQPTSKRYLSAVFVYFSLSEATWKKKVELYKSLGLSEEQIYKAFELQPNFMKNSEGKVRATMKFLVERMGLCCSAIAKQPTILMSSLEKRLAPRGMFLQELRLRGYITNFTPKSFLITDKMFLKKFVYDFGEESAELFQLYKEKAVLASEGKY